MRSEERSNIMRGPLQWLSFLESTNNYRKWLNILSLAHQRSIPTMPCNHIHTNSLMKMEKWGLSALLLFKWTELDLGHPD